ncbi:unnamed protein product [Phaedon cochleariae]|uniref:Uncharacterized protein n=1 Tax=Phaedon cochleariae TaxID=80249 RepID=A0A9N9SFG1_PHACE|nr:unnamed protein product [Phaedon cochleariae]
MKPYAVVYFTKEDMYSEIPTSWLQNNDAGYWPNSMNPCKLMQKGVEPDKENWEVHQLKIVGFSETLDGARKKAADSEYSTSNEDSQDAGRGRRRKNPTDRMRNFVISSSEEETMTPPPSPKQTNIQKPISPDINSTDDEDNPNNVEVVAEGLLGGARKKTVYLIEKPQKESHNMKKQVSTLNKNSFDLNQTPTPPSQNEKSESEIQIDNFEDVEGPAITLETLNQEIVKLGTICLSNKKSLNSIYTRVNDGYGQPNNHDS